MNGGPFQVTTTNCLAWACQGLLSASIIGLVTHHTLPSRCDSTKESIVSIPLTGTQRTLVFGDNIGTFATSSIVSTTMINKIGGIMMEHLKIGNRYDWYCSSNALNPAWSLFQQSALTLLCTLLQRLQGLEDYPRKNLQYDERMLNVPPLRFRNTPLVFLSCPAQIHGKILLSERPQYLADPVENSSLVLIIQGMLCEHGSGEHLPKIVGFSKISFTF